MHPLFIPTPSPLSFLADDSPCTNVCGTAVGRSVEEEDSAASEKFGDTDIVWVSVIVRTDKQTGRRTD